MAQEMGYYDDDEDKEYVSSSSDINYNHDNKRYSNNQNEKITSMNVGQVHLKASL